MVLYYYASLWGSHLHSMYTWAGFCWSRHQNWKQFTSYDEVTQEVSRLLSCTTTACLLLVNNLFWMHQWPIRQPSSSSTTQQSWNLLRYLIIASELFQVLMSASTDPSACVCGWSGIGCCYCSCADTLLHRIYVVNIILAVKVSFAKLTPRFCPSQYFFLIILIILIIMSSPKNYGLQVR